MINTNPLSQKLFLSLIIFLTSLSLYAECTYEQIIKADELPIGILLSWSTAFETNNSMFILEKSENGGDFVLAGTIRGAGVSKTIKKYTFLDPQPAGKKLAYRLKQVDFDGSFNYSDVLTVHKKIETVMAVVNIESESVSKKFEFTVDVLKEGGAVLQLLNKNNQVVWQGTKAMENGLQTVTLDLSPYQEGIYKVVIVMDKDRKEFVMRKFAEDMPQHLESVARGSKNKGKN